MPHIELGDQPGAADMLEELRHQLALPGSDDAVLRAAGERLELRPTTRRGAARTSPEASRAMIGGRIDSLATLMPPPRSIPSSAGEQMEAR